MSKKFFKATLVTGVLIVLPLIACKLDLISTGVCLVAMIIFGVITFSNIVAYFITEDIERRNAAKRKKTKPVTLSDFDFEMTNLRRVL